MTKNKLFSNFDPVSAKAFKQKIQFDLKGSSYNDTLVWNSNEGIAIKPFYHRDDNHTFKSTPGIPDTWKIAETVFILDAKVAGVTASKAIAAGTETIIFKADTPFDIKALFETFTYTEIAIHFKLGFLDATFNAQLHQEGSNRSIYIHLDCIGHLAEEGNWYHSLTEDHHILEKTILTKSATLTIHSSLYQNAGATMVQELAYGIAHANEYLNHIENKKVSASTFIFEVAIGSNYFFEIAKLRALRQLFDSVKNEYAVAKNTQCHIIAHPTTRNKTIYDYNTNMLRTTTECMSAILGGADTIVNLPYDYIYHKTNDFGQRISRNQLIILKKESYFDAVNNPADGTYYIESITEQLARKALVLFKDIEQQGGFLKQLKEGIIQRKIKESATKEQSQFDAQEKVLLGTNKHPNTNDRMKDNLELYPFVKTKPRKTLIEPIIKRRLSEAIEQERLKKEV